MKTRRKLAISIIGLCLLTSNIHIMFSIGKINKSEQINFSIIIEKDRKSSNDNFIAFSTKEDGDLTSKIYKVVINNKEYNNNNVPLNILDDNTIEEGGPFLVFDRDENGISIYIFFKFNEFKEHANKNKKSDKSSL